MEITVGGPQNAKKSDPDAGWRPFGERDTANALVSPPKEP